MFDVKKFFSGFNIFNGEKCGKILFFVILLAIGLAVYHQITRDTTVVRVEKGGKATINQNKEKNWGIGVNVQNDSTVGASVMYFF